MTCDNGTILMNLRKKQRVEEECHGKHDAQGTGNKGVEEEKANGSKAEILFVSPEKHLAKVLASFFEKRSLWFVLLRPCAKEALCISTGTAASSIPLLGLV